MELPSNFLLIIFYLGLVVMMLLGAVWFVYLLRMHKFADKELRDAEILAKKSMNFASQKIQNEIVEFEKVTDHSSIEVRNVFDKAINDYENTLMHSIEQQFESMNNLNSNLDMVAQSSVKRYEDGITQILKDAEVSIKNCNDKVKDSVELSLDNYVKSIDSFVNETEKVMIQEMEKRIKVYEEQRMAIVDNDLRKKIENTWREVLSNSMSIGDLLKSIKLGLVQFEKEYGGAKNER